MKKILLILFFISMTTIMLAQTDARSEGQTRHLSKWDKKFGEVKYKNNVYKKGSNWFSFGLGGGYHIGSDSWNQSFALAYHYRFRGVYFNAGWHYSTSKLIGVQNHKLRILHQMEFLNDFHLGAGLRTEGRWHNIGFFIGPSCATTLIPNSENSAVSTFHTQLGAYVETEFIFKYLYDMGIGVSLFGSFNKRYQVAGLQLTFYFSNAFITKQ